MPLRRPVGIVAVFAMVASLLALLPVTAAHARDGDPTVFLNEIHYDNAGTDVGEFVEVAGPAGTDLTGWSVVLYNGNGGASYDTDPLSGTLADQSGGYGFATLTYPSNGIQNGAPDGVALVDATGSVVQFLSYEGGFVGVGGPADGVMSTDIGVEETGTTPVGFSLQLAGTGDSYADFTWQPPAEDAPGASNNGQVFQASGAPAAPVASCPSTLVTDEGAAAQADVSATDADSRVTGLEIVSEPVDGITITEPMPSTASAMPGTALLAVAETTATGTYGVDIGFSTDDDPPQTTQCTVDVTVRPTPDMVFVHEVQGSGPTSPLVDQRVTVEAVVTSLITANDALDGFFVQEEDVDTDADPQTSEGVYVFCRGNCPTELGAGDRAQVTGEVAEFFDSTQIDATAGTIAVTGSGLPLPTAAVVELPAQGSTEDPATFESVEGMRTTIPTTLAVSEYFNLARFGELVLTADERPFQFTETNAPDAAGYAAFLADLATRRIVLDDDSNSQNAATTGPLDNEPYYYPTPGSSTGNSFRGGDTITGLTGVFEYAFGAWKLRPVSGADYTFDATNPRPAAPDAVGGRLTVASFNVLNYFATLDTGQPACGRSDTQGCRGANSEAERIRQLDKIVSALEGLDADVLGLIEIENDEGLATQQIVDSLNAATAPGTYDSIATGFVGTDAIKQAFLYQPAKVQPVGAFDVLTEVEDPRFDTGRNRPALIQTFAEVATGERVTVAVNHFKSKGSGCGPGDDSPADGSGNCDGTRTAAAQALADYLATDPTGSGDPDFLVIGDLNSYSEERPITALEAAGYTDLLERFGGEDFYGYLFDGQLGNLDHALASSALDTQVTGAGGWKINADELPLLDYNDTVEDAGERDFDRKSTALPLFAPDAFRSSDHDPVLVGLDLGGNAAPVADAGGPYRVAPGRTVVLDVSGSCDPDGDELGYAWDLDGDGVFDDAVGPRTTFRGNRPPGSYPVAVRVSDGELTTVADTVVDVVPPGRGRARR